MSAPAAAGYGYRRECGFRILGTPALAVAVVTVAGRGGTTTVTETTTATNTAVDHRKEE